jgi:hypothetical protein
LNPDFKYIANFEPGLGGRLWQLQPDLDSSQAQQEQILHNDGSGLATSLMAQAKRHHQASELSCVNVQIEAA